MDTVRLSCALLYVCRAFHFTDILGVVPVSVRSMSEWETGLGVPFVHARLELFSLWNRDCHRTSVV